MREIQESYDQEVFPRPVTEIDESNSYSIDIDKMGRTFDKTSGTGVNQIMSDMNSKMSLRIKKNYKKN